jgi:hypothetical protein
MKIENNDSRIDFAIDSYPLVELPDGFTAGVINTIRKEHPRIRFRLQFMDIALPMFLSLFSLLLLGICLWGMNQLDPLWIEYLKLEIAHALKVMTPMVEYRVNLVTLFSMMIIMFGSLITVWVINRPRKILRI